jgi:hypothetical protein
MVNVLNWMNQNKFATLLIFGLSFLTLYLIYCKMKNRLNYTTGKQQPFITETKQKHVTFKEDEPTNDNSKSRAVQSSIKEKRKEEVQEEDVDDDDDDDEVAVAMENEHDQEELANDVLEDKMIKHGDPKTVFGSDIVWE